jgi:hypothetical protein
LFQGNVMSRRRIQCFCVLLVTLASLTLVALDKCLLHDTVFPADKCPICAWWLSLAMGDWSASHAPDMWLAGRILSEGQSVARPSPASLAFSARAPPRWSAD